MDGSTCTGSALYRTDILHTCTYIYHQSIPDHKEAKHEPDERNNDMAFPVNRYPGKGFPSTKLMPPRPLRPPQWSFLALVLAALTICSTTFAQLTLSTSSLPLTVTLPALNTTTAAFDLSITSLNPITSLYLTLSICSLGSNSSIIPAVLVTTNPGEFDIDDNSVSDRNSGGVEKANKRARGGDVWALAWDKGFANWTFVDDSDGDADNKDAGLREIVMRIGFANGVEISEGNVVIQLAAALDGA